MVDILVNHQLHFRFVLFFRCLHRHTNPYFCRSTKLKSQRKRLLVSKLQRLSVCSNVIWLDHRANNCLFDCIYCSTPNMCCQWCARKWLDQESVQINWLWTEKIPVLVLCLEARPICQINWIFFSKIFELYTLWWEHLPEIN